jgi:serine/threonine protein kinase
MRKPHSCGLGPSHRQTAVEDRAADAFCENCTRNELQEDGYVATRVGHLSDQYSQDQRFRARFQRESCAAAILQEPHVIPIYDWGEVDDHLYIDMRLVPGQTLNDMLRAARA